MKKSIFIFLLTFIIVLNALNAQQPINVTMDYNARFDEIINTDSKFKTIKMETPVNNSIVSPRVNLKYNPTKEYSNYFIQYSFCAGNYKEDEVLSFMADAFADSNRDIFQGIEQFPCNCVKKYPEVKNQFIKYFESKNYSTSESLYIRNKFFLFQINNLFPNTLKLINNYFIKRKNQNEILNGEFRFLTRLIQVGEEERALELLDFFIQELSSGKILFLGDNDLNSKESVFALLIFSKNEKISKKAIELTTKFFKENNTSEVGALIKFIDINLYSAIIKKRFYKNQKADLSDNQKMRAYVHDMIEVSGILGKEMGKELWESIKEDNRLISVESFIQDLTYIFNNIILDSKLSNKERIDLINYYRKNNRFISDNTTINSYYDFKFYIHFIYLAFPNITKEDLQIHIPKKYNKDTDIDYAWKYALGYADNNKTTNLSKNKLIEFQTELKKLNILENDFSEEIDQYQIFLLTRYSTRFSEREYLHSLINKSKKILHFDAEGGYVPLNYVKLFEEEFLPILQREQIFGLRVNQKVQNIGDKLNYTIQIISDNEIIGFEYIDNSDFYNPQLFVKALNQALMKLGTKLRFVYFDTEDQTARYGLLEPNTIVLFMKKNNVQIGAISSHDGLMN
ncbi:MAG: hypothetical protein AB8H03_22150 [Saprospiraceae bacterium]